MSWRARWVSPLVVLSLTLAGCGGGGGSPQPGPPAGGNAAPGFTSAAAVNVAENSTGTVYQAAATDPEGSAVTFSLAGGADAARFAITAAGALSFTAPPDFEAPADADANNVYLVVLQASDGATSSTLNLAVTVTNAGPDGFRVTRVGTGFNQPVFVTPYPDNSGRLFVVERGGVIRIFNPATGAVNPVPFIDISATISTAGEGGLLGFVPFPNFLDAGNVLLYVTNLAGDIEIRRYRARFPNRETADPAADVIMTIPHPGFTNHYGGWMGFGPEPGDGLPMLYIATGDGGGAGDPNGNAQNRFSLLGKILRIDPFVDAFPSDNGRDYTPRGFGSGITAPEVFAYGLRNPFRASFDLFDSVNQGGRLWIGDVGQNMREEIDLLNTGNAPLNFGWNLVEGTANFAGTPQPGFTPPVAEYSHGAGPREGNSVTGGYVYRGPVEALRGHYFFADFVRPNIWSFPISRISIGSTLPSSQFTLRNADFTPNVGTINNVVSFGVDQAGNLYIIDFDGEIFRVEPT